MKTVKILNLYNEALELNGDTMNVTAFTNRLEEMGCGYELCTAGVGEKADFSAFDIVFVCHGKPRNVSAVSGDFVSRREDFIAAADSGVPMLFTGSANMLLGKDFEMLDGKTYSGAGLFDFTCREFDGMYVSDAMLVPSFAPENKMFGTYYRCEKVEFGKDEPNLFSVSKKEADGKHKTNHNKVKNRQILRCFQGKRLYDNKVLRYLQRRTDTV